MQSKADLFSPELTHVAEMMTALSHPARLMILEVLARRGTCICGDVVDELPLAQATVSRHLSVLKGAGLIRGEIDGPRSCYCVDHDAVADLQKRIGAFFNALPSTSTEVQCC